ncbi:HNH endonuclease [Streptomyces sp. NBC_00006]|uniref:HNH endonuclease n=1 Tax=Streptomyces sp. NBC_00006 TaxID=2975619 RepID=UPI002259B932|nr:HNH endonuclease signature motif containing protein [Streptomyces sp. NBC_00006]MCX5528998.1 HNH endonuclease [Streptomyces sp. NBC_00006]MCX5537770.1 HNH endonuclease [Streptomyces sp. NBC_00006]
MFGSADDLWWLDNVTFGSGVAKAIARRIDASGGGSQAWELDYEEMARDFEFTVQELREAVALMVANGRARVVHNSPGFAGTWLLLLTPVRLRSEAAEAEAQRKKDEARAAKLALRGGQAYRAAIPEQVKAFVFERDGHVCLRCGASEDLTLDHVHPWSIGGPDTAENLQVLCRPCNSRKGDRIQQR